ncbi:FAD-binding oxidoreductase [Motiliproteus sp. MSK22-1]|uniref:NAD(P)/FAD-dependent oxidoreductase n=1 Tax=Motiliproteus sp. MSK22-1 TaxID=1897630 RepID=UPI00097766A1|nr:FAD-dependent oxidoreductase [Motiliproteus sp. MSK22-1]OMH36267.1 FAD-dependent oxidoreductase [Motiliproteus sp. MSK22-1]
MYSPDANNTTGSVAVVGAGVVGLCTALEAQRNGYQVTLIDRDAPGLGASFGNAGYLATELIDPLSTGKTLLSALSMWLNPHGPLALPLSYIHRILPWLLRFVFAAYPKVADHGRRTIHQLNQASVPAWRRCLKDIEADGQLIQSGYLLVWESADKLEDARQHARYLREWGITTRLIRGEELAEMEPELAGRVSHALYFPEAYQVRDPYQLCMQLFSAFQARGGQFVQQSVNALLPIENAVRLQTPSTALRFDQAIVCAGAWSKQLLQSTGLEVPLEAERGYHLTIKAQHIKLNRPIGSAERRFVMSPLDSGIRVVGMTELGGLKLKPIKRRFDSLRYHCRKLITSLNDPSLEISEWMGHRPTLPDSLPVIDRHPDYPQLLFAFGNQHLGLTQAAISAEMVVNLMAGEPSANDLEPSANDRKQSAIDRGPFRVDRF